MEKIHTPKTNATRAILPQIIYAFDSNLNTEFIPLALLSLFSCVTLQPMHTQKS